MSRKIPDGLYAAFDIGTYSVKAAIIERRGGKDRLSALEEIKLKPLGDFPGENEFRSYQVEVIQALSEKLPINACREKIALVSSREYIVKIVDLPAQVQIDQLENILGWEAKKLLSPTQKNDPFVFGYRILRDKPVSVVIAVMLQSQLERIAALFTAARISLSGIYGEVFAGLALGNLLIEKGVPALALVNVGYTSTHLHIFSMGDLKFYRHVPAGMSELSDPPTASELEGYSQKIRFSFDYFRAVTKLAQIDEIFFFGGAAGYDDFLNFERDYFNPAKTYPYDISSKLDVSPVLCDLAGASSSHEKMKGLLPFMPLIGAFFAHLSEAGNKFNIYGRMLERLLEERHSRMARWIPLWIFLICLSTGAIFLGIERHNAKEELAAVIVEASTMENRLNAAKIKLGKLIGDEMTGPRLSDIEKRVLKPILKSRLSPAKILMYITKLKPDGVSIKEISVLPPNEAGQISFAEPEPDQVQGEPSLDDPIPGNTGNNDAGLTPSDFFQRVEESGTAEGLGDEVLIIYGKSDKAETISLLAAELNRHGLIKRYRLIRSRCDSNSGFAFILKGEMP